eukprot:TRINITY_DN17335_c0_g1::TRINITY_DN17335_c0_g1_i1::g.17971::m.17971 TRINITY_DN17335_c0_g1::TRINITY_DN17335_c0_g1_i1::g.17971  ORF type:complete len:140 (-),score=-28.76,dCMP_cyt_deam_2/PF08211.6/0.066,DUF3326/PF11805.3/0.12 TRINITY_DN17335_c0_g1_i1:133-552(-)
MCSSVWKQKLIGLLKSIRKWAARSQCENWFIPVKGEKGAQFRLESRDRSYCPYTRCTHASALDTHMHSQYMRLCPRACARYVQCTYIECVRVRTSRIYLRFALSPNPLVIMIPRSQLGVRPPSFACESTIVYMPVGMFV